MNDPRMMTAQDEPEAVDTADEDMLEQVRMGMGNEGGPPPGSGMKWQNLQEDQQALMADPSPENIQAFVQYWGQESLPPELMQMAGGGNTMPMPEGGTGGMY